MSICLVYLSTCQHFNIKFYDNIKENHELSFSYFIHMYTLMIPFRWGYFWWPWLIIPASHIIFNGCFGSGAKVHKIVWSQAVNVFQGTNIIKIYSNISTHPACTTIRQGSRMSGICALCSQNLLFNFRSSKTSQSSTRVVWTFVQRWCCYIQYTGSFRETVQAF